MWHAQPQRPRPRPSRRARPVVDRAHARPSVRGLGGDRPRRDRVDDPRRGHGLGARRPGQLGRDSPDVGRVPSARRGRDAGPRRRMGHPRPSPDRGDGWADRRFVVGRGARDRDRPLRRRGRRAQALPAGAVRVPAGGCSRVDDRRAGPQRGHRPRRRVRRRPPGGGRDARRIARRPDQRSRLVRACPDPWARRPRRSGLSRRTATGRARDRAGPWRPLAAHGGRRPWLPERDQGRSPDIAPVRGGPALPGRGAGGPLVRVRAPRAHARGRDRADVAAPAPRGTRGR